MWAVRVPWRGALQGATAAAASYPVVVLAGVLVELVERHLRVELVCVRLRGGGGWDTAKTRQISDSADGPQAKKGKKKEKRKVQLGP